MVLIIYFRQVVYFLDYSVPNPIKFILCRCCCLCHHALHYFGLVWYFAPCTVSYMQELLHYFPVPQWTQPCSHPPPSHKELLRLQQWVSPGTRCQVLQDTMWAIRDRTLELPQWWHHSMRGLWEGPPLVSHCVVWNQEQATGSECGLQMGHRSVVGKWRRMWQLWKVVRSVLSTCVQRSFIHFMSAVELVCSLISPFFSDIFLNALYFGIIKIHHHSISL